MGGRSRFVAELVDVTAAIADEPTLSRWVLEHLSERVAYDSAIYLPLPHRPAPPVAIHRDTKYLQLYAHLLRDYKRVTEGVQKGFVAGEASGAYRDTEVFSYAERTNLPFYAEIVRPQRITSQLCSHVTFRGERCGIMYLSRHRGTRRFTDRDEATLTRLLPAIAMSQATLRAYAQAPTNCDKLTAREQQIAFYIERGFRNHDIAAILGTSARTVRNQLSKLFDKVNVMNRAELVARLRNT